MAKKILFLQAQAPYGTSAAQETLDVLLLASAFAEDISVAFVGDGVLQLKTGQDPAGIHAKKFTAAFRALGLYGVEKLYVDEMSLQERGLQLEALLLPATVLSSQAMAELIAQQDTIVNL